MSTKIKLNRLGELLEDLDYPVSCDDIEDEFGDVTVLLADGETLLSDVVSCVGEDRFDTPTELEEELYANLPMEAVGEPGQSEGDA